MKYLFLVNRLACDGKAGGIWADIEHRFRDQLGNVQVQYPTTAGACQNLAQQAAESGEPTCIVTVGGEGTMNRALNGVLRTSAYDNITMALVPFGNVNDYGTTIGLQKTWQHALETLKNNRIEKVGTIRLTADGQSEYALNIADVGFGATTAKMHSVDHQLSWLKGQLKYNLLALKTLLRWQNVPARIDIDGDRFDTSIAILLAGFSPTLGGFHLVPHASPSNEKLAVTVGMNVNRGKILGLIEAAKKNRLRESEHIIFRHAKRVQIEAQADLVSEVDGEIVSTGCRQVVFEAQPQSLKFIVPAESPLSSP